MTTTWPPRPHPGPFAALDADWAALCRRHRRSNITRDWAAREPALAGTRHLADVIPAAGADRSETCRAIARLSVAGDDLASRALLQFLLPGIVRLAGRWTNHHGDRDTGWDIIARAVDYIGRLRERPIRCSPAGYILRSIERDLIRDARIRTHHDTELVQVLDDPHDHDTSYAAPAGTATSAEDEAFARPLLRHAITDAALRGRIPQASAEIIWLEITEGRSLPETARRTGTPVATAYRMRTRAHAALGMDLDPAC